MTLYSQRHTPPPTHVRYSVSEKARRRILYIIQDILTQDNIGLFLDEMERVLLREYGALNQTFYHAAIQSDTSVFEHFLCCEDERVLDFIEACFRLSVQVGGQRIVDEINRVFRQEGIGYQLTRFRAPTKPRGAIRIGKRIAKTQLPRIIRVDHQMTHQEIIAPALNLLSNPIFEVANSEMLDAHSHHRGGRHEDAITACVSAFESVLKTICDNKNWAYCAKDTCAALVDVCHRNELFPSFYVDVFKRAGTIRNKLSDAHGRGPVRKHEVEPAHAEHMLHMVSTHIILLCRLAGFE